MNEDIKIVLTITSKKIKKKVNFEINMKVKDVLEKA